MRAIRKAAIEVPVMFTVGFALGTVVDVVLKAGGVR